MHCSSLIYQIIKFPIYQLQECYKHNVYSRHVYTWTKETPKDITQLLIWDEPFEFQGGLITRIIIPCKLRAFIILCFIFHSVIPYDGNSPDFLWLWKNADFYILRHIKKLNKYIWEVVTIIITGLTKTLT